MSIGGPIFVAARLPAHGEPRPFFLILKFALHVRTQGAQVGGLLKEGSTRELLMLWWKMHHRVSMSNCHLKTTCLNLALSWDFAATLVIL